MFVYMGGDQSCAQDDVRRVRIDKSESVKIIPEAEERHIRTSSPLLMDVECHYGIEIIEELAFYGCVYLKSIKLPGVKSGVFAKL